MADAQVLTDCMQMKPVGYLRSVFQFKNGTPRQPSLCSSARGSLKIEKSVFNNPEHALEGLEQFSHAWIVFVFHKNRPGHSKAKVKPPRLNGKRVGVFSTRSPYRPNPVGLTLAKIERISGDTVYFSGIDIVDGTPVLDIKPFIPQYDIPLCRGEVYTGETASVTDASLDPCENCEGEGGEETETNLCESNSGSVSDSANDSAQGRVVSEDVFCLQGESVYLFEEEKGGSETILSAERDEHESSVQHLKAMEKTLTTQQLLRADAETKVEGLTNSFVIKDTEMSCAVASKLQQTHTKSERTNDKGVEEKAVSRDITSEKFKVEGLEKVTSLDSNRLPLNVHGKAQSDVDCVGSEQESKADDNSGEICSTAAQSAVAMWLSAPPVKKLTVTFTSTAEDQLQTFVSPPHSAKQSPFTLDFLSGENEIRSAIVSVLSEDPRSVYRREKCRDSLYYFTVDRIHVTCWFDDSRAEVVRLQPISFVERLSVK